MLETQSDIGVAIRIAGLRLRGQMQYRWSFIMQIAGNIVVNGVEVIVLWSLFQNFESLGGWALLDVIFLYGLSMTMFGIGDTLTNGVQTVPTLIREG
ncbi:MAG TPA: ABC-2 family transporter protein, partial [Thermomicrobiales bacterium]|nr:ABC-2 family transporter protein [Thermomicrobiales bacterium]